MMRQDELDAHKRQGFRHFIFCAAESGAASEAELSNMLDFGFASYDKNAQVAAGSVPGIILKREEALSSFQSGSDCQQAVGELRLPYHIPQTY
jgi:hypothetical protein